MAQFHPLKIQTITRETDKAVSVAFGIPDDLKDTFSFKAGQYITIKTKINGDEVRRAYSLCSTPQSGLLKVAIKEVEDGTFSKYANRDLQEGDTLEVHPPEGIFILDDTAFALRQAQDKLHESDSAFAKAESPTFAAFAAGSGITPVLSIIKTALGQLSTSKFVLVYGNKTPDDTIFRSELLSLKEQYKDRLSIEFIYSQSREDGAHFGRIMKSTVNFVVKNKYAAHNFDAYYLCGPEPMIKEVTNVLKENGASDDNIHFELFTASEDEGSVAAVLDGQTQIKILVDDEEFEFTMKQEAVILDAALDQDIDAPHSCQGGICSSCIARITEGTAEMAKNQILTDAEVAEGLVLTCQAHPTSARVVVDYDDV